MITDPFVEARTLPGLPEYRSCLVGYHEPPTIFSLEHIRYEGVEAESLAVLAQKLYPLDTHSPRDVSIGANVGFGQGDRDAVELAEAHFPGLADAVPADHDICAQRTDKCRVGLVRPNFIHGTDVTLRDCCDKRLTRSFHLIDV